MIELLRNIENAVSVIEELSKQPCDCNKVSLVLEKEKKEGDPPTVFCKKCQIVLQTRDLTVSNLQFYIDNIIMKK